MLILEIKDLSSKGRISVSGWICIQSIKQDSLCCAIEKKVGQESKDLGSTSYPALTKRIDICLSKALNLFWSYSVKMYISKKLI